VIFDKGICGPPDLVELDLEEEEDRKGSRCDGDARPLKFRISTSGILML